MTDTKLQSSNQRGKEGQTIVDSLFLPVFTPYFYYPQPKDLLTRNKREICDFLICWKDTVIIGQIKNYRFQGDHEKYHDDTVAAAANQISGAERRLFNFPRDIEIEHPIHGRMVFPRDQYARRHRIIVNLGEGEEFYPIVAGTSKGDYISVINKDTLEVMLGELDTPSELLAYLDERERFLRMASEHGQRSFLLSGREADLLGYYLEYSRSLPQHFGTDEVESVVLDVDGKWERIHLREEVQARKAADRVSYFVDELIAREVVLLSNATDLVETLLSFNRLERRVLGKAFLGLADGFRRIAKKGSTLRRHVPFGDLAVVCLLYHSNAPTEARNELVRLAMEGTALHGEYAMHKILVIATTEKFGQFHFGYLANVAPYSAEEEGEIREYLKKLGWFENLQERRIHEQEYPPPMAQ